MKASNFSKATMLFILASIWCSTNIHSQDIVSGRYYRLTTEWLGAGKSLDVVNDGKNNNQLQLANTGNFTGQYWKFTSVGNGYYRMTTVFQGEGKSLDVVNDGKNNRLQLANTGNFTGQYWKLTPDGNGYYQLTTQWQGAGKALDVVNDGKNNQLQLATTADVSGQFWKLTPLEKEHSFGGNGGKEFSYEPVKSISINAGDNVDAITINGTRHGGSGGTATKTLNLAADEFINKLEVSYSTSYVVNYLKFTTNKGNVIEAGKKDGESKTIQGRITALGGSCGDLLDHLNVLAL